ncbi:helicase associated domain-containing protein [Citricoccus alkalitolerans]|uniref:Helicase associated domain-containing protein n=1 Tax=Citricoccus alkalitolerans TaxID=246603 RepID=A0ABV8Y284_9MICC
MGQVRRAHPEWVMMADAGVPIAVIARLNEADPKYVRNYIRQRGEALRGGPAPARLFLHDRPRPRPAYLPDPDRRWRARLEELQRFLVAHQRRPHASEHDTNRDVGDEWALAHWLTMQRSEERLGRLAAHRARRLDQTLPSWRIDDRALAAEAAWRLKLVEVLRFHEAHGRLPRRSKSSSPEETVLASWIEGQHDRDRAGTLDPKRAFWLDRQVPGWKTAPRKRPSFESAPST